MYFICIFLLLLPTWRIKLMMMMMMNINMLLLNTVRALILYRRRRFINHLLTYLLTFICQYKRHEM